MKQSQIFRHIVLDLNKYYTTLGCVIQGKVLESVWQMTLFIVSLLVTGSNLITVLNHNVFAIAIV